MRSLLYVTPPYHFSIPTLNYDPADLDPNRATSMQGCQSGGRSQMAAKDLLAAVSEHLTFPLSINPKLTVL